LLPAALLVLVVSAAFFVSDVQAQTVETVLRQLETTETSVNALNAQITQLHQLLSTAEATAVSSTKNVTVVRAGLFTLEASGQKNNRTLFRLAQRGAKLNSTVEYGETELNNTIKQIVDVDNATQTTAASANETANPEALAKLEKLTDRIWQATNPQDPNNLDDVQKSLVKTGDALANFKRNLTARIHLQFVKRLHRGTNMLSKALRRLGRAGESKEDRAALDHGGDDGDGGFGSFLGLHRLADGI